MPLPPLPKGATPIDDDQMPPLPKGATEMPDTTTSEGAKEWRDAHAVPETPSTLSLYEQALFNPVGSGAHPQGLVGGAEQIGGKAMETMAPPFAALAHPVDSLEGLTHAFAHPIDTAKQAGRGFVNEWKQSPALALENAAGTGLGLIEGGRAGTAGTSKVFQAVPTTTRAGRLLSDVDTAAKGRPVVFARTTPELENAQRLSTWGHGNITPLDSLYQRMQTINPVDYEEARGRYSPLTRLTASDMMRATPKLQGAARRVAHAMKDDIGDTAESVGMRPQYERGMKMYARASRNREWLKSAGKFAVKKALPAAGLGWGADAAYNALKK